MEPTDSTSARIEAMINAERAENPEPRRGSGAHARMEALVAMAASAKAVEDEAATAKREGARDGARSRLGQDGAQGHGSVAFIEHREATSFIFFQSNIKYIKLTRPLASKS